MSLPDYLWRSVGNYARAVYLLTGTGIVRCGTVSLRRGDKIDILYRKLVLVNVVTDMEQPRRHASSHSRN
jgi:hypothetical protein